MIDKYKISKELEYLLASYLFRNKPQIKRLLVYLIDHVADDGESAFDQRAIAVECLGRGEEFDPAENPVVRIEIGRLRRLLEHFYKEESPRQIVITIPLGQYRPAINYFVDPESELSLPKLEVSPERPESLSLLLQFETNGEESSELYLLRHQIRIGLTVHLGKLIGVRLVVALPDDGGNINSHVDFIVRVAVGHKEQDYQLLYSVLPRGSQTVLFGEKKRIPKTYNPADLDALISAWGTDLLDREAGLLWVEWVRVRALKNDKHTLHVQALVSFQRYLLNDTPSNLDNAFSSIIKAQQENTDDNMINAALSELYYRIVISGCNTITDPVGDGLLHVRTALRTNPACARLHLILAFMMFFSREHQMAKIELDLCLEKPFGSFSFQFHTQILNCLMSGLQNGMEELRSLCHESGTYPELYAVMLYLQAMLDNDVERATVLVIDLDKGHSNSVISQCVDNMILPEKWAYKGARTRLRENIFQHLSKV